MMKKASEDRACFSAPQTMPDKAISKNQEIISDFVAYFLPLNHIYELFRLGKGTSLYKIDSESELFTSSFFSAEELVVMNDAVIDRNVDFITHTTYRDENRYFGIVYNRTSFQFIFKSIAAFNITID